MITTLIGKTFLNAYNEKYNRNYSAKEFFENEYFELFFNHQKYMQWITNSPFVQMKAGQKPEKLSAEDREEKLQNLFSKVKSEIPDASFAIGYPASESKEFASTSGLVSDIKITIEKEDIYYSWIGSGLGIGVAGGYSLLINDAKVLLTTYDGWKFYRKYLSEPTLNKLRGNQVNSWNGQWLTYKLGKKFDESFSFSTLEMEGIFKIDNSLIEVNTVSWSNLFFSLSNLYPEKVLNSYIYSFGQTNKTVGFIPIYLKAGKRLIDVFKKLFYTDLPFNNKNFQTLFGMHIKRACELGNIGLHALQPDNIKKYIRDDRNISFKNEEDNLIYQSYKTWLIAMLSKNKEEITDYTIDLAKLIQRYRAGATGTNRMNLIKNDLLGSKSKKGFIDALTEMVNGVDSIDLETLKHLKDEVHLMTNEEFGYFNTLLKFDYAFVEKQS
ncbi:hypothetical protein LZQ00_05795 [Sphingobacterium sp. SRCM116780]|uniref:hypothetical protein n=1 Tax=Sphingobacterium sp. SRCM116780 TaxID=2907623 RepID=UPI001F41F9DB|nr:hypothetical protein [Sphingobacterium sp. SRCM116780]UIR57327.1 hypothetical protein LZQ00_05795 [Sphingobacterium sp. SRCM116780]